MKKIAPKKGFTLVEMVITIVLITIIFAVVGTFLNRPIQAYAQTYQLADIADMADMAIIRLERDVRNGVPNSLRTKISGNFVAVEMVNAIEGQRYRVGSGGGGLNCPNHCLNIGSADGAFDVEGKFAYASYGSASNYRLVIYNTGAFTGTSDSPNAGVNVYSNTTAPGPVPPSGSAVITPSGSNVNLISASAEDQVSLSPLMNFGLASPRQRLYVVDTPITYLCNLTAGTLTRYWGYAIQSTQPIDPTVAPLNSGGTSSALIAKNVSACTFNYNVGSTQQNGILGIDLVLTRGGESVRVYYQVNSNNSS